MVVPTKINVKGRRNSEQKIERERGRRRIKKIRNKVINFHDRLMTKGDEC